MTLGTGIAIAGMWVAVVAIGFVAPITGVIAVLGVTMVTLAIIKDKDLWKR